MDIIYDCQEVATKHIITTARLACMGRRHYFTSPATLLLRHARTRNMIEFHLRHERNDGEEASSLVNIPRLADETADEAIAA